MTSGIADALRYIDDAKLTGYLLGNGTEKSRSRLNCLVSFGFDPRYPQGLREALPIHWTTGTFTARPASGCGEHGNIRGKVSSPAGRDPGVTTAWTKRTGERVWRFATLPPK